MKHRILIIAISLIINVPYVCARSVSVFNETHTPIWVHYDIKILKDNRGVIKPFQEVRYSHKNLRKIAIVPLIKPYSDYDEGKRREAARSLGLEYELKKDATTFILKNTDGIYSLVNGSYAKDYIVRNTDPQWSTYVERAKLTGSPLNNPMLVTDVVKAFDRIPDKNAVCLAATNDGVVPSVYKTSKAESGLVNVAATLVGQKSKVKLGRSHFQAIKRCPEFLGGEAGKYAFVTGGDIKKKQAHLFIIKMNSEPARTNWRSNLSNGKPYADDRVVKKIILSGTPYWHPGGIDICGKYLVITLQAWKLSEDTKVFFYDITDPENPRKLAPSIHSESGIAAAALTRLPDNHYLLGLLSNGLGFYYSKTDRLEDGFYQRPTAFLSYFDQYGMRSGYQNINFIMQKGGRLFLAASQNTKNTAPVINGDDYMDLFEIEYDTAKLKKRNEALQQGQSVSGALKALQVFLDILPDEVFAIKVCRRKHMYCKNDYCNFNAGATIYIPDSYHLNVYAVYHWLHDNGIRFAAFQGLRISRQIVI